MDRILNLYKERTETPLERIKRFVKAHEEYRGVPMSYAGRLDPMAEGVLLVLAGKENKHREEYLSLHKTYRTDILFGFATDSGDALGILTESVTRASHKKIATADMLAAVASLVGSRSQRYPAFSSKPLKGEPLHAHARRGYIDDQVLPVHTITISHAALIGLKSITEEALLAELAYDIPRVHGSFRQVQTLACWEETLRVLYDISFEIATIDIVCSSGTYVRELARELGAILNTPALAYRIVRISLGSYAIEKSLREPIF